MKLALATVFVVLLRCLAFGASPDEEFWFLNRVRVAYMTTNIDAIMALHCWDGIEPSSRGNYRTRIKVQFLDRPAVDTVWYATPQYTLGARDGYVPNLQPIKYIRVQFQPARWTKGALEASGPNAHVPISEIGIEEIPVGEKNGKLMLSFYIPKKSDK